MEKQYTIQEVRTMICEFFDTRNPYKYLDEAAGYRGTDIIQLEQYL